MKTISLAALGLALASTTALSADLGGVKDAPTVSYTSPFSWTGVHVDGSIGGAINRHDIRALEDVPATCHVEGSFETGKGTIYGEGDIYGIAKDKCDLSHQGERGFLSATWIDAHTAESIIDTLANGTLTGGAGLGYRQQLGAWVIGGKFNYDLSGGESKFQFEGHHGLKAKDGNAMAAFAELGYTSGRTLIYMQGGYGWTKTEYAGFSDDDSKITKHHGHAIIGAGIDYAITPNWVIGASYEHWFSDKSTVISGEGFTVTDDAQRDAVKGTVSYKF